MVAKVKPNVSERLWGSEGTAASRRQLSFADRPSYGGPRAGAGRKRTAGRKNVPHRARPAHRAYRPAHVTLRRAKGLPSLRSELLETELREAVRLTRRDDFRISEFSVQRDHLHML